MVSCLTLIHHTHVLMGQQADLNYTACGLAIAERHVEPGLFAADPNAATCEQCRHALEPKNHAPTSITMPADPKLLVARFFERVLNTNEATTVDRYLSGTLAAAFTPARVQRLHELFPIWRAIIDVLIAEDDRVMVGYHVAYNDAFGLLGPIGRAIKRGQAVILRVSDHRLVEVNVIVDGFDFWSDMQPPARC